MVNDDGAGSSQVDDCEFAFMTLDDSGIHNLWFLDSCWSRHLTNSREGLFNFKALAKAENVNGAAEGAAVSVVGIGDLRVSQNINGKDGVSLLKNVGYAPKCRTNLISLGKAQVAGVSVNFQGGSTDMMATHNGKILMKGDSQKYGIIQKSNLQPVVKGVHEIAFFNAGEDDSMELAHKRTCHTAVGTLLEMERLNAVEALDGLKSIKKNICSSCVDGKATKSPHLAREKKSREVLQLMHTDLVVKIKPVGLNGEQHCHLLTDDLQWSRDHAYLAFLTTQGAFGSFTDENQLRMIYRAGEAWNGINLCWMNSIHLRRMMSSKFFLNLKAER